MLSSQGPLRSSSGAHYLVTEYGYLALREAHMGEGGLYLYLYAKPEGLDSGGVKCVARSRRRSLLGTTPRDSLCFLSQPTDRLSPHNGKKHYQVLFITYPK